MIILYYIILYSFSDNCIQPDDGQTKNGRNISPTTHTDTDDYIELHYII